MKIKPLWLLALVFFTAAGCAANRVIFSVSPEYAETCYTETEDGWSLALHHYPPKGVAKDKPPVILCHGLNQNYLTWDLSEKYSLARMLSQNGYDVWSISLRGSGKSTKPGWDQFLEINQLHSGLFNQRQYDYSKFNWNLDDYIFKDIPVLLKFVQEKTGKTQLTWVGHSMGGTIACAYLGMQNNPAVKNLVLIGAPGMIPHPLSDVLSMIVRQEPFLKMGLIINTQNFSVLSAPVSSQLNGPMQILAYNMENMRGEMLATFHSNLIENTSPGVVHQIQMMMRRGDFYSLDGKRNYSASYYGIKANLLCLAGKLDNLCPPAAALDIYTKAQSADKTYRLFGIANGYSADYGHNDLILGKNAPQEVYPYIMSWLDQH